jgi:hypothetical protein
MCSCVGAVLIRQCGACLRGERTSLTRYLEYEYLGRIAITEAACENDAGAHTGPYHQKEQQPSRKINY